MYDFIFKLKLHVPYAAIILGDRSIEIEWYRKLMTEITNYL